MANIIQNSSSNLLFKYISEINKIPLLTSEEELYHAKEKDNGNINSAKILVSSHLRLVVKIANKYKNYGLPMMDLISEGNIGLMRAVKTFDYTKGFKLATYSMWWIKAFIQEYILKSWSLVKIGTSSIQKKLFFNLNKIKNKILSCGDKKYLNNDDIKQISQMLNVSDKDVIEMDARINRNDIFLNAKSKNGDDDEIINFIPAKLPSPEDIVDKKRTTAKNNKLLLNALESLTEREREIITLRRLSDDPLTLSEISKKCGISGERVRQIEAKAIEKMRIAINKKALV